MTVFIHGAFSKKDMNMWIPFKVSSESMKSKNESWCKSFLFTIHLIERVENSVFSSIKKSVEQKTVFLEANTQSFIDRKNNMTMRNINDAENLIFLHHFFIE